MRKGIRFQTKLILTIMTAIALVTVALLTATSSKVRQAYTRHFASEFDQLVTRLQLSQSEQSSEFLKLSKELAAEPFIIETLLGTADTEACPIFWGKYAEAVYELDDEKGPHRGLKSRQGPGQPADRKSPLALFLSDPEFERKVGRIGVMDTEGNVKFLRHDSSTTATNQFQHKASLRHKRSESWLKPLLKNPEQQTIYLPQPGRGGGKIVKEMITTPVIDPATDEIIGIFLRSTLAETEAQRSLEKYQEEFESDQRLKSGVYVAGLVYGRGLSAEESENMGADVDRILEEKGRVTETIRFEDSIAGNPYLFYLAPLGNAQAMRPAYQVAAFPLTHLQEDLAELRLRGSGIGALALILGAALAFFLARNLAGPIQNLSKGTEAIRRGHLDYRVEVRSKDELGELGDSFNEMAEQLQQKAIYRELLEKVSDESVAQAMISGSLDLELGGEVKEVSVLFCDIRGFTRLTEHMHPSDVIEMLNEHMTAMTAVVRSHFGVVDKFVGDEIMAVFGALKSYGNDAHLAAACGLEMLRERARLNEGREHPIEIGIGIATGEVVAGCMGSIDRLNYTVLGSRVNLAARLCSAAGPLELVIDDATLHRLPEGHESEERADLQLKGFSESVQAHRLLSAPEPEVEEAESVVEVVS